MLANNSSSNSGYSYSRICGGCKTYKPLIKPLTESVCGILGLDVRIEQGFAKFFCNRYKCLPLKSPTGCVGGIAGSDIK